MEAAYKYGDGQPVKLEKPAGVTSITHVIGTWPYAAFTEGMDESLRTTGMIKSDSVKLVSLATPKVEELKDFSMDDNAITIKWTEYPDKNKLDTAASVKDISLRNSSGEVIIAASGTCLFDYTKLYGPIRYMADVTVNGETTHIVSKENKYDMSIHASPGDKVKVEGYYAYESGAFTSNKISKEKTITATITIPRNADMSYLQNWANQYDFVSFKTETTNDPNLVGTYTIVDQNNNKLTPEQSITINNSGFRIYITYYVQKEHSLEIIPSTTSGGGINLSAILDDDNQFEEWTWDIGDESGISFGDPKSTSISISVSGTPTVNSFVVYASSTYVDQRITVYVISDGEGNYKLSDIAS